MSGIHQMNYLTAVPFSFRLDDQLNKNLREAHLHRLGIEIT